MKKEYVNLVIAASLYAIFGILAKLLSDNFTTVGQVMGRTLIGFITIFLYVKFKRRNLNITKKDLLKVIMLSFFVIAAMVTFTISANNNKLSNAIFLLYAGSIFMSVVLDVTFYKEKITKRKLIAILFTMVGLIIFAIPINFFTAGMIFVGFLSGILDTLTNFFRKRLGHLSKTTLLYYQFLFGALILLGITIISEDKVITTISINSLLIVLFGFLLIFVNWLINQAFRKVDLTIGTLILCLEIFIGILLGFLVFGEVPMFNELIGGLFIFASFLIINVKLSNKF